MTQTQWGASSRPLLRARKPKRALRSCKRESRSQRMNPLKIYQHGLNEKGRRKSVPRGSANLILDLQMRARADICKS